MAHRPYPNVDRALRMVDRHKFELPPLSQPSAKEAADRLATAFRLAQPSFGDYVLSLRRPGVVSRPR
ncbi:hypothetical protein ACWEQ7_04530 [Streptomyces sp. NPDC004069]